MKTVSLLELFTKSQYETSDNVTEQLFEINRTTKTRVDSEKTHITQHFGIEQSFLLYFIGKTIQAKNFVEIGTGRGTTSFSIALQNQVNEIHTFDIVPFDHVSSTAVNFKSTNASNRDLFNLIPYDSKHKISFKHINTLNNDYLKNYSQYFDLAFIDGCHDNYDIIINDFLNCEKLMKDDGVIVFDDYGNFPVVTKVIDDLIVKHPEYTFVLVTFRGHLFMKEKQCNQSGEVIMFKDKSKLNLFGL